jgi:Fur family peroxide stress response transcriptional regulator
LSSNEVSVSIICRVVVLTDKNLDGNHWHVKQTGKNVRAKGPVLELDVRLRHFISRCRDRGVRVTTQRLAVFQALARNDNHPTADSLYAELRESMPFLSFSTVYRILESLEDEGLIRRVSSTSGITRYDANLQPHQHLVCRCCGRMTDLEDESLSRIRLPGIRLAGFVAEELDIRILGICAECRRPLPEQVRSSKRKTIGRRTVPRKKEKR